MKKVFSRYLLHVRTKHNLTQREIVDFLIEGDNSFERLDITTYSRWERGVTEPKLTKQILIARIFRDDITLLIDSMLSEKDAKTEVMREFLGFIDDPYWVEEPRLSSLIENNCPTTRARILAFHQNYLKAEIASDLLSNEDVTLVTRKDSEGHLLGHFLYTFVPVNLPDDDYEPKHLHQQKLESKSTVSDAINFYFISGFSSIPDFRLDTLLTIIDLIKNYPVIKNVVINCHNQRNYNAYETHTENEIIGKGKIVNRGGIKLFGKRYSYVRLKIRAESILSTKAITNLLPYIEEMN